MKMTKFEKMSFSFLNLIELDFFIQDMEISNIEFYKAIFETSGSGVPA